MLPVARHGVKVGLKGAVQGGKKFHAVSKMDTQMAPSLW